MGAELRSRVAAHLRAHHEWYWAPLVYCAAFVVIYHEIFFPGEAPQRGFGWDTIEAYWPDLAYLAGSFAEGDWPLWNPFDRGGYPYFAMPERGPYYPLNWLLAGAGAALGETSWWLGQLKAFLHHVLAGSLMHLFLRSRDLPRAAAIVGALAWMVSAPMLLHKASSIIWPMVWTPLIWLATDKLVERPSWRRGAGLGGALVLAGHAGSAPGFFYTLLLTLPYGVFRAAAALAGRRRDGRDLGRYAGKLALCLGLAAALTVGMLLILVGPALELTAHSQRAERTVGYALMFPMPPRDTLTGLLTPTTGTYDAYLGVVVVTLALCALALRPVRDRGAPIVFAILAAFFLALAFGEHTPLLAWLVKNAPGFDLFRVSNRYKLLFAPVLAALAGYGAAAVMQSARTWGRERITALVAGALVVAAVAVLLEAYPLPEGHPPMPRPALSLLLAGIAAVLVAAALLVPRRWALVPILCMAPVVVYEPQHYVHFRAKALEPRPDHLEDRRWLAGLADLTTHWRVYDEFVMGQRAGTRLRVRELRGYPAGGSLELPRYRALMRHAGQRPSLLGAYNVRYVLHGPHHRAGKRPNHIERPPDRIEPERFDELREHVYELAHPAPMAAWYGAARVVEARTEGARRVLDAVYDSLSDDHPPRHVVIEPHAADAIGPEHLDDLQAHVDDPPPPIRGEVLDYDLDAITVRVDAPAPGLVVVNEILYPGWQVHVDGERAEPIVVNALLRGVAVGAGAHTVTWVFEPARFRLYRLAYLGGILVLLAAALSPGREGWRRLLRRRPAKD